MNPSLTPTEIIAQLNEANQAHVSEIVSRANDIHESSDEEEGSNSPIFDSFYKDGGSNAIKGMCNFTAGEFDQIWMLIFDHVSTTWNVGRGKKSNLTGKDMLFMSLCVLKHGQQWELTARLFKISCSTLERQVTRFLHNISEYIYEKFVKRAEEHWTMRKIRTDARAFAHFDYARYATDVTFQQSNRPSGNMTEGKKYFSGKHKLYGYKVELSVLPIGICIGCTKHYPGSVSDLEIFRQNSSFHEESSKKVVKDFDLSDEGMLEEMQADFWAILADKGYQGATEFFRVVHPKKVYQNSPLSTTDQEINRKISSDRIIVENYFGRLCSLWTLFSHKWRWNEGSYDVFFKIAVALTNFHVKKFPLQRKDQEYFSGVRNRLRSISHESCEKRKRQQEMYASRRRQRLQPVESMQPIMRELFEDSSSD